MENTRQKEGTMENRTIGRGAILALAAVVTLALVALPASAHHCKGKHKTDEGCNDGGGDDRQGGKGTAMVTISGPMVTAEALSFSFGLDKDTDQTLRLNSWTGAVRGAPVPIAFMFTDDTIGSCLCQNLQGKKQKFDPLGEMVSCNGLERHLNDFYAFTSHNPFPSRWHVAIEVENPGDLRINVPSETNHKGGHSIAITTDPLSAYTWSGQTEVLWIPEGPNKSGLVTVTLLNESVDDEGKRLREFSFNVGFWIQVLTDPDENKEQRIMRCETNPNEESSIIVTVVTPF